jgi:protein ImuB
MFGALYAADGAALLDVAADFSPRYERRGPSTVVLDLGGLERLFGDRRAIAEELRRAGAEHGITMRVAIAGTCTAAHLLAIHTNKFVVVETGAEPAALSGLRIALLPQVANENAPNDPNVPNDPHDLLSTFRRWGLRTLGDLAALPADAVAARLGTEGVRWHRLARGEDLRPLRSDVAEERFEQAFDLEWPIEGLEPLSFVLGRLLEPLAAHLERRGRGAAVLHLKLHLVTQTLHERSLQLPAAMRDARTLRTLLLLDLEANPPPAAIDRVVVAAEPTPARVLQCSLLTRPLPSPEQLSTLMARLGALMGKDRCGSPAVVDSWKPGAFGMKAFNPSADVKPQIPNSKSQTTNHQPPTTNPTLALRRYRVPVPARVRIEDGKPTYVATDRRGMAGGRVQACAGPWRTSGNWWMKEGLGIGDWGLEKQEPRTRQSPIPNPQSPWDRDEWDVTLGDGATYRVFRERGAGAWFVDGTYD